MSNTNIEAADETQPAAEEVDASAPLESTTPSEATPTVPTTPTAATPSQEFTPPFASTPVNAQENAPATPTSPAKKNIRFMDESISKIHVFPSLPVSPEIRNKKVRNFATYLPTVPDEPGPYNPILYTFRVPSKWPKMLAYLRVRTPPFYLQLDHTIAVIWCMFSPTAKKSLGIAQLQWALSFLKSIFNKNNERPKDIQHCIDAILDYIIELYADISNKLDSLKNMEKSQREEEEAPVATDIPFSINYSELLPKFDRLTESALAGGNLVNTDDIYRQEVEGLKEIVGTDSVDLISSKSREAAIDYLNDTLMKHIRNMTKEAERVKSLENLLSVITADTGVSKSKVENMVLSLLRQNDSSDIEGSSAFDKSKEDE
ncbi:hypothetical protein WA026_017688 [Henosepilachna vigintioctopunctata]|uniref:Uncharacterized protein n=1 Tax=Henosepilachna vigintioctopunctata TaxID=420089 RepID=A0AAW1U9B4_9CUCU